MRRKKTGTRHFFEKIFTKNQLFILLLSNLMISSAFSADFTMNITTQINYTTGDSIPRADGDQGIYNINSGGSINVTGLDGAFDVNSKPLTININADAGKGIISDLGYAIADIDSDLGGNEGTSSLKINLNSGLIASNRGGAIAIGQFSSESEQKFTINTLAGTSILAHRVAIESYMSAPIPFASTLTISNAGDIIGETAIKSTGTRSIGVVNSGTINGKIIATTGKLTIFNTAGSITGSIDLGLNSESVITLSNGLIDGNVKIGHNSQIINLNGGTYLGNINGSSASLGTVNINSNQTLNSSSSIGSTYSINNLNINSGALLTLNSSSVSATNINLLGSLNLGDTATTITGNVVGSGSGLLNVGSASHAVNGNLTLNSGDTLKVLIANDGAVAGKAIVGGLANVASGAKLEVDFASSANNYRYITGEKRYTLIDGVSGSGSISAINDSDININNTGSNKFSVFTLSTSMADNDLFLDVARKSVTVITDNESAQNAYNAINTIGDNATGSLKEIQRYIDGSESAAEVELALKSVAPQADNGVILGAVTVVNNSVATVENRLDAIRNIGYSAAFSHTASVSSAATEPASKDGVVNSAPSFEGNASLDLSKSTISYKLVPFVSKNSASSQGSASKSPLRQTNTPSPNKSKTPVYKLKTGLSSGDKVQDGSVWTQAFGTAAKQGDLSGSDGYKSTALGFAFGYDKEISKNTHLGLSLSYANSTITGKDSLKKTDIDTYQINTYGGKSFGKYFADGIVGASWNEYSSKRTISAVSLQANANYSGQNYVAKIRTGMNQNLGGGFTLSPNASLNYIRNNISNYTETGADTLSLQVKGSSTNFFEARVGTILSYETISAKGTKITPKISASYGYNFLSSAQTISGNFVGQSVTFNTISAKLDPRSLKLGTGIDLYNLDSITISADYNMERKQKYQSHSGVLKFRYSF